MQALHKNIFLIVCLNFIDLLQIFINFLKLIIFLFRILQILIFIFGTHFGIILCHSNCDDNHFKLNVAASKMIFAFIKWQNLKEIVIWDYFDSGE